MDNYVNFDTHPTGRFKLKYATDCVGRYPGLH